jgi:aminoglycoside phosphotransferase family enzyme/predicted kinase
MPWKKISAETATRAHVVEDQSAVFDFLGAPATHGMREKPVRVDTHGAVVFLAGENAYKVKRAVKFPFMDFSTLAKRETACKAEIEVNRENAPHTYIEALPVTRANGGFRLGGSGEAVEWVVHMRRFDERRTLDHVAEAGGLSPPLLAKLVRAILASHARAPRRDGKPAAESLRRYVSDSDVAFKESPELFPVERVEALTKRSHEMLARCWDLMLERGEAGFVRRCHGDLHLRNIALLDGEPTLFDAVEFDDSIATGDVLYDLGYLLMDIWERGLKREANLVLNRYLWGCDAAQIHGLAALPIFLSIRAAIRSKVLAAGLQHLGGSAREAMATEAQQYFRAAESFLELQKPRLVAIGGLSGTGKTTLGSAIAPFVGSAPGAIHLRSDIERKVLAGVDETHRLPANAYTPEASRAVYAALRKKAGLVLAAGYGVIVDAVHAGEAERDAIEKVAAAASVPFCGLWLDAPAEVILARVQARTGDASDATEAVVRRQLRYDLGEVKWTRLETTGELTARAEAALAVVLGRPATPGS